jgi:uncharacterized membrane protein HdeD (DUF308 family)
LLSGILGVVVGLMLLGNPIQGGITLTILLASFLFVGGIFKAVASVTHRFGGWGWLLLNGVIDIALGVMIWRELPVSGLTIIGLLVGISTIFRGGIVAHARAHVEADSGSSHEAGYKAR